MSQETSKWLNENVLVGHTDKRGHAWHYRAGDQGAESNHYSGAIPVEDIYRRLFHWEPVAMALRAKDDILTDTGVYHIDIVDNSRQVIVRPDTATVLGVFKDSYQVHPYRETLVELTQKVVGEGVGVGSAGLLKGGAVGWVQFEMESTESHAGVDFRPFVSAATSLDGTLASQWVAGSQVIVCDNTLSAALGAKDKVKISKKHTKWSLNEESWSEIRDALQITIAETKEAFNRQVEILTNHTITDGEWAKFLDQHFGAIDEKAAPRVKSRLENRNNALTAMWLNDERCAPWHGTAYGVLATVNTFTHHIVTPRAGNRIESNMLRAIKTDKNGASDVDLLDASIIGNLNTVLKQGRKKVIQFA